MPAANRFTLNRIGQIAFSVADVDRAEAFYRDVLDLRHLYRYGNLTICGWRFSQMPTATPWRLIQEAPKGYVPSQP